MRWLPFEIAELRKAADSGLCTRAIAALFPNRTYYGVRVKMLKLGIRLNDIRQRFSEREGGTRPPP